jgi:LemA protein
MQRKGLNMGAVGYVIIIVVFIILMCVIWYVSTMNSIRRLGLKCNEAASGIDVALTKRYDVLTKQLEVVKEYTSHEAKTLYETIKLRSGMSIREKQEVLEQMNNASNQFRLTAEAYPNLLSSETYKMLMVSISDCEEHLQAARRLYNANVNAYNTKIVMFPSSIVAGAIGAISKELFVAEAHKRNDVEMKFH